MKKLSMYKSCLKISSISSKILLYLLLKRFARSASKITEEFQRNDKNIFLKKDKIFFLFVENIKKK